MNNQFYGLLNANVFIRHLLQDEPNHSARATELFEAIERNERLVRVADVVICEVVFVLHKSYHTPRAVIRDALAPLLGCPSLLLPGKRMIFDTFDLWVKEAGLSFVDCYQLCLAKQLGLPGVITFDREMNRLPGVERIEP